MDYAAEIKEKLTLPEIVQHYGFKLNRQNRMPCPFHHGGDNNLGVKDGFFHCFVCGCKGDQISFVQNYFGISFRTAIQKLNDDFMLGLPIGERITLRQRREMEHRQQERKTERERRQKKHDRLVSEYWVAFDAWKTCDTNKREYAPQSIESDYSPLFVEAVKNIDQAAYLLSEAEMRLRDYEINR